MDKVLSQAEEKFTERYQLQAAGYTLGKLLFRVAEIMGISVEEIAEKGKDRKKRR